MTTQPANTIAAQTDLTLCAADATRQAVEQFCAEARQASVHGVCVNGSRVELACALLEDSGIQVVALVGFPLGAMDADVKRYETEAAVDHGAHEIDCVLNLGRLKDGDSKYVLRELLDIVEAADERPVKVILESHLLRQEEQVLACQLLVEAGAKFAATATAFNSPAVTVAAVALLRQILGESAGIKAAGGIRDAGQAQALLNAGATRLGIGAGATWLGSLAQPE